MKTHQLSFTTLLLFLLLSVTLKAQIPAIESLEIIPVNPTTNDTVKVISHCIFPSGGCPLTSFSVNISEPIINVNVAHTLGMLAVICYSTDTISIGKLNAKNYDLIYNLSLTTPPVTYDIDTISFTVLDYSGIPATIRSEQDVEIYPNPFSAEINILLKNHTTDYTIDICSILGQKIKTINDTNKKTSIDLSELNDGIYFVLITNGKEDRWIQKIIKRNIKFL